MEKMKTLLYTSHINLEETDMKIIAFNGSPRGAKGNTEVILQAFLEGVHDAGEEVEVIYLKDKTIKHCIGCFTCWIKTPGVCVHKDDMPELLDKIKDTDVIIGALPLYIYTVPGLFKDFMDRMIPLIQPHIEKRGDRFTHPSRYGNQLQMVLISNAGFPETHNFDALKQTFRLLTDGPDSELVGMICCAGGPLLTIPAMKDEVQWYLDAAKKAGFEVVSEGRITPETQAILDRPLPSDPVAFADMANAYWASQGVERIPVDEPESEKEDTAEGAALPPPKSTETIRDMIAGMPLAFNAEAAGELEAAVQFDITDEEPGDYYITISKGVCTAYEGKHAEPTVTIKTPADVWLKISRGEMNGAQAFMMGKFKVSGKMDLLMKMAKLFSAPPKG
jgi:multimeric flavodoxin WrbA/putative sterol carrier protein